MGFLRSLVKLAAVGVAANMVLKARREGSANRATALQGSGGTAGSGRSVDVLGSDRSVGASADSAADVGWTGRPGTLDGGRSGTSGEIGGGTRSGAAGLDSLSDAERLRV